MAPKNWRVRSYPTKNLNNCDKDAQELQDNRVNNLINQKAACKQNENFNKEIKTLKKNQTETLELNNLIESYNNRLDKAKNESMS